MLDLVQRMVAWLMNRVRVNHVRACTHDGAPVFVKRRRAGGRIVIWFANRFLALAGSGTHMLGRADDWTDWEVHCARLLYPGRPASKVEGARAVIIPRAIGSTLRQLYRRGEPDVDRAFILAGRELRRAHGIQCSHFGAAWSHGDLHLDNILCDGDAERAVLIDFDTRHDPWIGEMQRQSDDVKGVLLELIGLPENNWSGPATAFIEAYRGEAVLREVDRQLTVPRGAARVLWYARTNCAPLRRSEPRLESLRQIIEQVVATPAAPRPRLPRDDS
jgi:hypothetical protein